MSMKLVSCSEEMAELAYQLSVGPLRYRHVFPSIERRNLRVLRNSKRKVVVAVAAASVKSVNGQIG